MAGLKQRPSISQNRYLELLSTQLIGRLLNTVASPLDLFTNTLSGITTGKRKYQSNPKKKRSQ